ncbi:helix-turn-helix domain-containing protein [Trueperella sp. LYQ143]|uniref:helix-turn-helix domain-containing protein n=1 Tax=Trueperella sp. LYQ143 TaxID=3391059 RepID=UPI003983C6C8
MKNNVSTKNLEQDSMLSIRQVSHMLGVPTQRTYTLIWNGELPAYKIGGTYRIKTADVEAFLESKRVITC